MKQKRPDYCGRINSEVIQRVADALERMMRVEWRFRDKGCTAAAIAPELGVPRSYISAAMADRFHTTSPQYVNTFRVKAAARMLADDSYGTLTVAQVGGVAGFANEQSFHTAFHRRTGLTPQAYRTKHSKSTSKEALPVITYTDEPAELAKALIRRQPSVTQQQAKRLPEPKYVDERFADIQMLRYRLDGFERLTLQQKVYAYCLAKAALSGRDIITDQHCRYNLEIRKTLEAAVRNYRYGYDDAQFILLRDYLKRVWFASGIHHHYGMQKFRPQFSLQFLRDVLLNVPEGELPLGEGETRATLYERILPIIFDDTLCAKRVSLTPGQDLVRASACNFYQGVTQAEAEAFYRKQPDEPAAEPAAVAPQASAGLNTRLVKDADGTLREEPYTCGGLYGPALRRVCLWLKAAKTFAENLKQRRLIDLLIAYYNSGNLDLFDHFSIQWLQETEGKVDFINGFIEVYGDPLGLKGAWEGLVEYRDEEATRRTQRVCDLAQWAEDHSPAAPQFRKTEVRGVHAHAVCAAMLGGDEYPATAIGINLPNAEWIREQHGSKSVTISNIIHAYDIASKGSGLLDEFCDDEAMRQLIRQHGDLTDRLHTDLHECLGHGSGRMMPGVSPEALKACGSTIEEARADLYGLYFMADPKLVEAGLLPDQEAYRAQYYEYMMNGLLTQLARIEPGHDIEEAHMRNRALIARWAMAHSEGTVRLEQHDGRTFLRIDDYPRLRQLFAQLLAEVQRIKSEGDLEAAQQLINDYAVSVPQELHAEVRRRYEALHIAPYKGFINPRLMLVTDDDGHICDIVPDYTESYSEQMMRYSKEFGLL